MRGAFLAVLLVLVGGACGGEAADPTAPALTVPARTADTTSTSAVGEAPPETNAAVSTTTGASTESSMPDPCSLLTVDEAAVCDPSITSAEEPMTVAGATTRACDYGPFTVTVGPGGAAGSLRYEGMEEEGIEAVDISVAGADGAVAYLIEGTVWQVAAAGPEHSVMILLWSESLRLDSPEMEQLRLLLETAFGRL